MKLIIAIIQPTKYHVVRDALAQAGIERMTVCDAQGYGRQKGQLPTYRGVEYRVNMLRKIAIEIWVNDDFLERAVDVLTRVAKTGADGNIGDGKIFVLPTEAAYTSDGLTGPEAI